MTAIALLGPVFFQSGRPETGRPETSVFLRGGVAEEAADAPGRQKAKATNGNKPRGVKKRLFLL